MSNEKTDEYASGKKSTAVSSLVKPLLPLVFAAAAVAVAFASVSNETLRTASAALTELATKNQILQAFVASSLLGLLSYLAHSGVSRVISLVRGRTFCSVTISNKDESFQKVIDFIGKQGIVSSGCLVASTHKKRKTWKDWRTEFLMGERHPPRMDYQPANNNDVHVITYRGCRILMHRTKGETVVAGWERLPMQMESLTLSSFGSKVAPLKALIDDALAASFDEQQDELTVFVLNDMWGGSWEKALSKKPRSIESVILDEDLAEELLADARDFLKSADWYQSVGIPYRRGYLLYGPPGCGKTSFCQALAGALRLDVCMLTLTNKNLNDNGLAASLRDAPANAIVLLEDVDAVFVDRALQSEGGRGSGVTFSGLLNALDGVASQEGRLFFMTTNHIEKLDPALVRPGRCDLKVEVRRASRVQARKLFSRFFNEAPEADAAAFASALPEYELSMAALQGYLLEHKTDAAGALAHVQRLLRASKPLAVDRMRVFDHLRRVGLEGWSVLFEHHGYLLKADLRGLTIDTVKQWSGYLRMDARACKRMELLLAENSALMEEYQLVDMATAKEMFVAAYSNDWNAPPLALALADGSGSNGASDSDCGVDASTKLVVRQASDGGKDDGSEEQSLSRLADKLCARLQRNGKAAASIWQLRHHLHLHAHSAHDAVATAPVLIEPSPPCGADALDVDRLGTYEWLRRAGLEKHATALEAEGYGSARMLYGLPEGVLKDDCGIRDKKQLKRLTALLSADASSPRELLSFTAPDYARLRVAFTTAFAAAPGAAEAHASRFAAALSDGAGHGLVSLYQLEAYLTSAASGDKGAAAAADGARADLVEHERPPPPPKPEVVVPTEWVYGWLKEKSLEKYAGAFISACLAEKAQLQLEPRLGLDELKELGVNKMGDARKLYNAIKRL